MTKIKIPDALKRNRAALTKQLEAIARDPELLRKAEEFQRRVSTLTARDLWQRIEL